MAGFCKKCAEENIVFIGDPTTSQFDHGSSYIEIKQCKKCKRVFVKSGTDIHDW